MSAKRGSSRRGPSLAVLPLALLATLIVLSQRKWNAGGPASRLAQPDQDLGAAFAKAAERERGRTDQSAAAAEVAAKVARATVAAKDAAAAEVAAAAEASTTADEAAARAAAVAAPEEEAAAQADAADEAAAAAVGDADETAAATADADGAVAAADEGESAAAEETDDTDETATSAQKGDATDAAEGAADAWEPAGAEDDSFAAAGAADDPLDGKGAASAPDAAAAAGEPAAAGKPGLEEETAALAAALDSSDADADAAEDAGAAAGAAEDAEADSQSAEAAEATPAAAAADAAEAAQTATSEAEHGHSDAAAPPDEEAAQPDGSQPAAAAKQQAEQQGGQQPCTPAGQSPAEALDSLLASTHEYFLSVDDVRRGVAFRGSGARAQAVAAKLMAGQPVHVAVVGGSVTWGQGAIYGGNFGVRFFNWINATWPSPHHRFTNAAKPAVTSSLYAICGGSMVPQDADIIVLEFAFNDNYPGISLLSPPRAAYEQLMRRMLNFPNSPLVMSLHFFGYWIAKPKLQGPDPPLFYATGEDDLAVIAQHYDVPVLSVRNAALHHMEAGDPGFKVDVMDPHQVEGLNITEYFYFDDHHPYDLTGHRAMADLLVAVMQDAARHVVQQQAELAQPAQQQQAEQQQQQQADQAGQQAEQQAGLHTGQQQGAGSQATEKAQQAQQQGLNTAQQAQQQAQQPVLPPVPDPMFPGNWESPDPTCRLGASFKDVVVDSEGFDWRPQNPNATEVDAQKWAWQGNAPGAWALLRLNTDLGRAAKKAENARVILGHVRSWRELGSARLECVGGCRCPTLRLEHKWKHKSTQTALVALEVSQHPQCEIRVTVAKPAGPDAATILNAVMVDRAGGAGLEMGNVGQWDMMGNVGG